MTHETQRDGKDDDSGTVFAEIPFIPAKTALNGPTSRWHFRIVFGFVGTAVIGMLLAFYFTRPALVDPNAPKVVADVIGMHCPIQCGLRVGAALEKLPFVLHGSVSANPQTGVVQFAVTSNDAVDQDQIRRAIENAGFRVQAVRMLDAGAYPTNERAE